MAEDRASALTKSAMVAFTPCVEPTVLRDGSTMSISSRDVFHSLPRNNATAVHEAKTYTIKHNYNR